MDGKADKSYGLLLGDLGVSVLVPPNGSGSWRVSEISEIPPAVVLGVLQGEPFSVDLGRRLPSGVACAEEVVGTGFAFPPAARTGREEGSGRFPLAFTWGFLSYAKRKSWVWKPPGGNAERTVDCGEAIASCAKEALQRATRNGDPSQVIVVVPNNIPLDAQESLLRFLRLRGIKAHLLWRPVAAALGWIAEAGQDLYKVLPVQEGTVGELLTVHLGLDQFEIALLTIRSLTAGGKRYFVPARDLPSVPALYGEGMSWSEEIIWNSLREGPQTEGAAWHLLWGTDFLRRVTDSFGTHIGLNSINSQSSWKNVLFGPQRFERGRAAARKVIESQSVQTLGYQRRRSPGPFTVFRRSIAEFSGPFDQSDLSLAEGQLCFPEWCRVAEKALPSIRQPLGFVASGPLAVVDVDGVPLAEYIVNRYFPEFKRSWGLLPRSGVPYGSELLKGVELYLKLKARRIPPYFDKLPRVETLVVRYGEPLWQNLTAVEGEEEDPYVVGGELWRPPKPLDLGLGIRREEKTLTVSVWRQGHASVRDVKVEFPRPVKEDVPVSLELEMVPGQGNPRIQVVPKRKIQAGSGRISFDWRNARDTGEDKQAVLESLPRTNPPLEPRRPSLFMWQGGRSGGVLALMKQINSHIEGRFFSLAGEALKKLIRKLNRPDRDAKMKPVPEHATAVSSEGTLAPMAKKPEVLERFIEIMDRELSLDSSRLERKDVLTALAYCSADSPNMKRLVESALRDSRQEKVPIELLKVIGNCLRDPPAIKKFAQLVLENFERGRKRNRKFAPNNWIRALCRILQYREDAAREFDRDLCSGLTKHCLNVMKREIDARKADFLYRHASLCLVYLLRYRRYENDYLEPESKLAEAVKCCFREAIRLFQEEEIDPLGGIVDIVKLTQMMIDYIDRKGRGRLVWLE